MNPAGVGRPAAAAEKAALAATPTASTFQRWAGRTASEGIVNAGQEGGDMRGSEGQKKRTRPVCASAIVLKIRKFWFYSFEYRDY
ncbi:hypothetical protein G6F50_018164 [Rhizopus delemar]|uniref:Uncharacterized protein n=1 Tax=Rhizopus delemar TaxID=936053 RepID=A0A9P6XP04_9FUNG|nr:hypothetical protein G6F50_018164 [Rhizopus delemar]